MHNTRYDFLFGKMQVCNRQCEFSQQVNGIL